MSVRRPDRKRARDDVRTRSPQDADSYDFGVELDARAREDEIDWRDARRFWRTLMLAPDFETLEAILDGEEVEEASLDAGWLKAFGGRLP